MVRYIMSYCLCVGVILSIRKTLNYTTSDVYMIMLVCVCFAIVCITLYRKKNAYICLTGLFVWGFLEGVLFKHPGRPNLLQQVGSTLHEIYLVLTAEGYYLQEAYEKMSIIIISLLLIFIIYLLTIKWYRPWWVITAGFIYYISLEILGLSYSIIGFGVFIGITILYYYEEKVLAYSIKKEHNRPIICRLGLLMISLFIVSISTLWAIHKQDALSWMEHLVREIEDIFTKDTGEAYREEATVDLHNKPYLDKSLMMQVEADDLIYLRGMVYETFDGTTWKEGKEALQDGANYHEMVKGLQRVQGYGYKEEDYFRKSNYKVTPEHIAKDKVYSHLNSVTLQKQNLEGSSTYESIYYQPRIDSPSFIEAIAESREGLYREIGGATDLIDRALQMKKQYTQLPEISESLRRLVQDITKDCKTYIEKVRAIEYYLSSQYRYTLEPELPVNSEVNLVDYFLFQSKEGFCIHYASSMVVMVRALGIPARYVSGYKLSYTIPPEDLIWTTYGYENLVEKLSPRDYGFQTYYVRDTDAHAWVEVYFEGFGWLTFEPTGAYYADFHQYAIDDSLIMEGVDVEIDKNTTTELTIKRSRVLIIVIGSLIMLLVLVCLPLYKRIHGMFYYKKADKAIQLQLLSNRIMVLLERIYEPRLPSCSIQVYMHQVAGHFNRKDLCCEEVARMMEAYMYAKREVTLEDLAILEAMYNTLKDIAREGMSWRRYWWYYYRYIIQ